MKIRRCFFLSRNQCLNDQGAGSTEETLCFNIAVYLEATFELLAALLLPLTAFAYYKF